MSALTPAKKAFLLAITLYTLLLFLGYLWYTANTTIKTERETLTTVPVTLAMFQPQISTVEPAPKKVEATPPEPIKPAPPVEKIVSVETPIPAPKKTPIKVSTPPKKVDVIPDEPVKEPLKKPTEVIKKVVSNPRTKPETETKEILPPPVQAVEHTQESVVESPPTHPNLTAKAEQHYLSELNAIIAQHAYNSYPRRAKRRNWQGEVLIQFTLLPNGRITRLNIIESSGRQLLDNAALEIFQRKMNQQFKPFPQEIARTQWRIEVPVSYYLK